MRNNNYTFTEEDHNLRLDFMFLQKIDFRDKKVVEMYISQLEKNIKFLRGRSQKIKDKLSKALSDKEEIVPGFGSIVPEYWKRYKKYRLVQRKLEETGSKTGPRINNPGRG